MKNKDLIKKLKKLDPEAEVIIKSDNFEHANADIAVSYVHEHPNGSSKIATFRDAFDGELYEKEVFSIMGGNKKVIKIS